MEVLRAKGRELKLFIVPAAWRRREQRTCWLKYRDCVRWHRIVLAVAWALVWTLRQGHALITVHHFDTANTLWPAILLDMNRFGDLWYGL